MLNPDLLVDTSRRSDLLATSIWQSTASRDEVSMAESGGGLPDRLTLPRRSRRQGLRARFGERLRPAAVFEP
jgi:hypothetical protein